jgi:hypothetical protein
LKLTTGARASRTGGTQRENDIQFYVHAQVPLAHLGIREVARVL